MRIAERAAPNKGGLRRDAGKPLLELLLEAPRATRHESIAQGFVLERRISATHDHAPVLGRAHVEIGTARFPHDAIPFPRPQVCQWLGHERIRRVKFDESLAQWRGHFITHRVDHPAGLQTSALRRHADAVPVGMNIQRRRSSEQYGTAARCPAQEGTRKANGIQHAGAAGVQSPVRGEAICLANPVKTPVLGREPVPLSEGCLLFELVAVPPAARQTNARGSSKTTRFGETGGGFL